MPAEAAQTEILTHTIDILRVAAGLREAAIKELEKLEITLQQELLHKGDMTVNKAGKTEALLTQTQAQIADAYAKISQHQLAGLAGLAKLEGKQAVNTVNAQIGASVVTTAIGPKLLEAIVDGDHIQGHSAKAWWAAQAEDLRFKFAGQMREGLLRGETVDELARRVRGTKAAGFNDGIMAAKKREAEALVRSSAISISNEARLRSYAEMGDIVKGIAWLATLDTRTTPICRALDGLEWTLPDFQPIGHDKKFPGPVAHWNCRSTQMTVLRSWDELAGKKLPSVGDQELQEAMEAELKDMGWSDEKIGKAVANTRASMDGQVPATLDFDSWMKAKGDAFIEARLGPGRAALYKSGKVTVRDLTDQNNRPLNLKELAAKIEKGIAPPETLGIQWSDVPAQKAAPYVSLDPVPVPAKDLPELTAERLKTTAAKNKTASEFTAAKQPDESSDSHNQIEQAFYEQGFVYVLRDKAGKVVAAISFSDKSLSGDIEVGHVGSLVKGGGTAAMKIAAEAAAKAKVGITLFSLEGAVGFYEKLGFEKHKYIKGMMTLSPEKAAALAKPSEPTAKTLEEAAPAKPAPTAAELKASAELATQAASKTWAAMAKQVITDMPDASPVEQLAVFNEKKLQKQQASFLNDTAAMNTALGKTPPTTQTLLNKLAADDPAKLAFHDKVELAKAKLKAEADAKAKAEAEAKAAEKAAAEKAAAEKAIADFAAKSPEHATVVNFLKGQYEKDPNAAKEIAAAMHTQLDDDANAEIQGIAGGTFPGVSMNTVWQAKKALQANKDAGYAALVAAKAAAAAEDAADAAAAEKAKQAPPAPTAAGTPQAIAGLAKAIAAGKKLNMKQMLLKDKLEATPLSAQMLKTKVEILQQQSAPAKAATKIATGPDTNIQNLAQELPDPKNFSFVKTLPGSTQPGLYADQETGKEWVVKKASGTSQAHVESEALADSIYRAAGAKVPFSAVTKMNGEVVKIAEFIPGAGQLSAWPVGSVNFEKAAAKARQHFVLDALLGNWDAVGTGKNNMLVSAGSFDVWRIDNGGALLWRAMGAPKDAKWLTREVQELKTLTNPKLNADAAAVYKGITTDEINAQIADIISRKDAILHAAEAGGVTVVEFLKQRIGYLETLLPAGMAAKKTPAPAAASKVIPDNIVQRVAKAKSAGIALDFGSNQVEDNNAIVWQERQGKRNDVRMQLKVTAAGSKALETRLAASGFAPAPAAAPDPAKPVSATWAEIEPIAKHIGYHAGSGTLNPMKVGEITKLQSKMWKAEQSTDPETKAMGKYYQVVLADLKAAAAENKKPSKVWPSWEKYLEGAPKIAAKFKKEPAPEPETTAASGALAGWKVKRLDKWDTYRTTVDPKDKIRHRTNTAAVELNVGIGYELTKGSVTVRFAPQRNVPKSAIARIMLGVVQVWVNGTEIDSGTAQAMQALHELGLDTTPPTDAQREIQYLHKGWYQHNKHTRSDYKAIYEAAIPDAEKAAKLRALSEKEFNVTLPKSPAGWDETYNPRGYNDASDGTGYRVYYRWDKPRAVFEKEMAEYQLNHGSSHMVDAVKGWLESGRATPTYDRVRMGVSTAAGLSAGADMKTGGAMYLFSSVTRKDARGGYGEGSFRWKVRNLARLDTYSLTFDGWGNFDHFGKRVADLDTYKQMTMPSGADQALLKNGLSFVDEIDEILAANESQRAEIITLFKDAGYATLPDGRKVETVVKIR